MLFRPRSAHTLHTHRPVARGARRAGCFLIVDNQACAQIFAMLEWEERMLPDHASRGARADERQDIVDSALLTVAGLLFYLRGHKKDAVP